MPPVGPVPLSLETMTEGAKREEKKEKETVVVTTHLILTPQQLRDIIRKDEEEKKEKEKSREYFPEAEKGDEKLEKKQEQRESVQLTKTCPTCYYPTFSTRQIPQEHHEGCVLWGRIGDNWKEWKKNHGNVTEYALALNHSMVNWSEEAKEMEKTF